MRAPSCFVMKKLFNINFKKDFSIYKPKVKKNDLIISIYFGPPGCGKSTTAALIARKYLKKGITVYSNTPIAGTLKLDPKSDLGVFDTSDAKIIVDEASIEFNNRRFKEMQQYTIEYLKTHRHYVDSIDFFSQSWDDIDITIRRLAQKLYLIRKTIFPWFIILIPIDQKYGPSEDESEIIFKYKFGKFWSWKWKFTPPAWKLFNTLEVKPLPKKDWIKW